MHRSFSTAVGPNPEKKQDMSRKKGDMSRKKGDMSEKRDHSQGLAGCGSEPEDLFIAGIPVSPSANTSHTT